jgi:U3 small nucleolar RNA-associated protein 14
MEGAASTFTIASCGTGTGSALAASPDEAKSPPAKIVDTRKDRLVIVSLQTLVQQSGVYKVPLELTINDCVIRKTSREIHDNR